MARSSAEDPIEKFRFTVTVLSLDLSITGAIDALAIATPAINNIPLFGKRAAAGFSVLSKNGFSEITLPKVNISEINYRENTDSQRFIKIPGLARYEPIILRRGVTNNRNLYNWYRLVNDDTILRASVSELSQDKISPPAQTDTFRKEILITAYNRNGIVTKQWMLFNAFPISYKGGNDFKADTEEKLIEEITLTYESFLEVAGGKSGLAGFFEELAKDSIELAVDTVSSLLPSPAF